MNQSPNVPANHLRCAAGDGNVRRGEAVIRSNGREQIGWHKSCWTLHRATKDIDVARVEAEARPLTTRIEAALEAARGRA